MQRLEMMEIAFLEQTVLAVEALAAQPNDLGRAEAQLAHEIEMRLELSDIDLVGETNRFRAFLEPEADIDVRISQVNELVHQQLVEIRIEQRAHDRIDMI